MNRRPFVAAWLLGPIAANWRDYAWVALAAALINVFALSTSLFSMTVYDRVVPANATNSLIALTIGMGFVLAFDVTLRTLRGLLIDHAGHRIDRAVGQALFARLLALPLAHPRGPTGAFAGSLREFEPLRDFFTGATLAAVIDLPFVALFLAAVWAIGGSLALVPLAMLPLVGGVALACQPALGRATRGTVGESLSKQAVLVETVGALETVRAVGAGPMMARRWMMALDRAGRAALDQRRIAARAVNVATLAQSLSYVGTIACGVAMVGAGHLTTGALVACSLLGGRAVAPLAGIANLSTRLTHARASYRAIDRVMRGAAPDARRVADAREVPRMAPAIALEQVSFRYPGAPAPALAEVSLAIAPGERVGVIGRSGSGKSTIGKLITGLYAPERGRILVGRGPACAQTAGLIGCAPQDPTIFSGSLRDNIALDRADIDDATLIRVARLAGVAAFAGDDPAGYDRRLPDHGGALSGGQRQAVALARALAGGPSLLVLDEPTAAIDPATEATLIARLAPALADVTLVIITHRRPLLALVDRLIVVEAGRIVVDGPRDAVLAMLAGQRTRAAA